MAKKAVSYSMVSVYFQIRLLDLTMLSAGLNIARLDGNVSIITWAPDDHFREFPKSPHLLPVD